MPERTTNMGLKRFFGEFIIWLNNSAGIPVKIACEDDGTIRAQWMLYTGAAQVRAKGETTGELDIVNHGKDSGGTIDPLRTNASQQLQVEVVGTTLVPSDRKVLGSSNPSSATDTVLYTVPASTKTKVTMFSVANLDSVQITFRMGLSVGGGALASEDYVYYDIPVPVGNSYIHDAEMSIDATDEIRIYASTANVAFKATGEEYA